MRTIIAVAAVACTLWLAACNTPNVPPGNYGNVAGTITSSSGQPLAGAVVTADYGTSSASGPDGKYIVAGVPISSPSSPAHIEVTTVPSGYRKPAPRDDVQVVSGQTTQNVNFVLQPL